MSDDDWLFNPDVRKRGMEQFGLSGWCPQAVPRPAAVTEAWAVERDDAVIQGEAVDQAAGHEVTVPNGIAMNQDHRRSFATLDIVQANAVDLYHLTGGWVLTFGPAGSALDPSCGGDRTKNRSASQPAGTGCAGLFQQGGDHGTFGQN
jgi:hypothetical protein